MTLRTLDLFSGIGGFSLGLERTGEFATAAFCEINAFCRRQLGRHWPGVPIYHDIRSLTAERLRADGIDVDVICGGFPCQDISVAGAGAGLAGARSGLWWEYARLIEEIGPRWVIVENVAALRSRGLDVVLGTFAALRYDVRWDSLRASAIGAPHHRNRLWILANAQHDRREGRNPDRAGASAALPCRAHMANSDGSRFQVRLASHSGGARPFVEPVVERSGAWLVEPDVGRVADGVPDRVDRLRALGNAVVPQIPELLGRAVLAAERRQRLADQLPIVERPVGILDGVARQHGSQVSGGDFGLALLADLPAGASVHFDNNLRHGQASVAGENKAEAGAACQRGNEVAA